MALMEKLRIVTQNEDVIADDVEDALPQSPAPGETPAPAKRRTSRTTAARQPSPGKPNTTKLAKEVAADIATLIEGTAVVWGMTDQCCAPTLEAQAKPIADALVPILSRNPKLLAKLASGNMAVMVMQFIGLGRALAPVATSIYHNHVAKVDPMAEEMQDAGLPLDHFPAFGGIPRDAA